MKNDFGKNFERKFSKYAIPNLSMYLVLCYAFGYLIQMINYSFLLNFTLEPALILRGQIWRLVTWIFVLPRSNNLFFVIITLYFYYSIGTTLEKVWGTYRYNCYLFSGMLFTVIGTFLLYGMIAIMGLGSVAFGDSITSYYVAMSIFLAFAVTFPDMQVLFMFVIPVKVKYMGIIYGVYIGYVCLIGSIGNLIDLLNGKISLFDFMAGTGVYLIVIGSSLFNFLLFCLTSRKRIKMTPKQVKQRQQFRREVQYKARVTRHKCAICGRTEESNPELEFRFCSKCNGNFEYCQDHLFTHKHVE